ncbi:MaoC/PaaZ C-terminal domain-containing protein [Phenylobacterium sp. LjRoot225]|uniref:MaoC/PaaZ C-terminal domain-containing protein n=1 Tax=Phenylobacterium sp. LjRoot225 TaxID=3342285 RepID=UPI003ECECC05
MSGYDHLIGTELVNGCWSWDSDRALLYAVGVGAGLDDPLRELPFTTENSPGVAQQVIPSFLTIMGLPSPWVELLGWKSEGLSPVGMVHGEQSVTLARSIPTSGKAQLSTVLRGVYDKGSGALVVKETRITLADTGEYLGSTCMRLFAQGKGGFGGPRGPAGERAWRLPDRSPDQIVSLPVGLNQSLIYRLSGDHHLHGTDPARARADGFERPVFYGLGSYGVACRALVSALCDGDVARFGHMEGRFSKPVYPGDRLDTRIWRTDDGAGFQMWANGERLVLDRGVFRFRAAARTS